MKNQYIITGEMLEQLICSIYNTGHDDGYAQLYNEEFVGRDKKFEKPIIGREKVLEIVRKQFT